MSLDEWYNPTKMGVCSECGYEITDDEETYFDGAEYKHARCAEQ